MSDKYKIKAKKLRHVLQIRASRGIIFLCKFVFKKHFYDSLITYPKHRFLKTEIAFSTKGYNP